MILRGSFGHVPYPVCVATLKSRVHDRIADALLRIHRRKSAQPADLSGLRVLVIDDQEDAREAFSAMLQSSRAQVETAPSAVTGLAALARFKPDIALCDIAMPEEDGPVSFARSDR